MEYLTAKQTIGKLRQGKVTDISEAYFSQLVSMSAIPFHMIPGKKRKLYLYDEVKEALVNIQDPSRDGQRKANAEKRETKRVCKTMDDEKEKVEKDYSNAMELIGISEEQLEKRTGYKGDVLEEAKRDLARAKHRNAVLHELAYEQKELIYAMPFKKEEIHFLVLKILRLSVENMMLVEQFYEMIDGMDEE